MKRFIATFSVSLLGAGLMAHGGATGVVLERMNAMTSLGSVMKSVQPVLKGEEPNFSDLKAQAAVMNTALVVLKQGFPEDSLQDVSEASPQIWEDPEGFQVKMDELEAAINAFTMATNMEDQENLQSALQDFAGTCKSCHQDYRVKK